MSATLLRRSEVCSRTGLSRTTVYRLIARGQFPPPRQLGPRSVAWVESEIAAWIDALPVGTRVNLGNPRIALSARPRG